MIRLDVTGQLKLKQRLALLTLPAAKRKRLLGQLGRKIRTESRKRLRAQRDIKGHAWAPRKNKSTRKMLRGLSKHMVVYPSAKAVDITFKNGLVGRIARKQQEGIDEVMTREKMQRLHGQPDYQAAATRNQAKALRAAGYQINRAGGKGKKTPTLKWVVENLTVGQAGLILKTLQGTSTKSRWVISLPARSFLGANKKNINEMVQTIFDNTINARA